MGACYLRFSIFAKIIEIMRKTQCYPLLKLKCVLFVLVLVHTALFSQVVYLVGDAGDYTKPGAIENFKRLDSLLSKEDSALLVFLGDNIYPIGLQDSTISPAGYEESSQRLRKQLLIGEYPNIQQVFVPGNHDWNGWSKGGKAAVLRSESFIRQNRSTSRQLPPEGCSGPKVMHLSNDLVLVFIDSQWYLHPWKKEPTIHQNCAIKERDEFSKALKDTVMTYIDRTVLICMHHPIYSRGSHGGKYSLKEHIFPATMFFKNAYIPLPILGSILVGIRALGVTRQDIPHPLNRKLQQAVIDATKEHPNAIVASGHEHNLQHYWKNNTQFIVSGGGCKHTYLRKSKKLTIGYNSLGFFRIEKKNDQVDMKVFSDKGIDIVKQKYFKP